MKATAAAQAGMRIVPYSPSSFLVVGDTFPHKDKLTSMYGAYSKHYVVDGIKTPAWCFSLKREQQVREWLMQVGIPRLAPTDKKAKPKATKKKKAAPQKAVAVEIAEMVAKEVARLMAKQQGPIEAVKAPKVETPCSKERIARALAGEPMSAYHWAMRHVLEFGLQPSEIAKGTGLFGKDRHGNTFGESERRSIFWMLNAKSTSVDLACCEDCPEHLRSGASEQMFWDIVTEFSGPGGKGSLVERCIALSESTVVIQDCPF